MLSLRLKQEHMRYALTYRRWNTLSAHNAVCISFELQWSFTLVESLLQQRAGRCEARTSLLAPDLILETRYARLNIYDGFWKRPCNDVAILTEAMPFNSVRWKGLLLSPVACWLDNCFIHTVAVLGLIVKLISLFISNESPFIVLPYLLHDERFDTSG